MAFDPDEFRADLQGVADRLRLLSLDYLLEGRRAMEVQSGSKAQGIEIARDLFNAQWAAQEERPKHSKIRVRIRDGSILR